MFELFDRLVRRIRESELPDVQAQIKAANGGNTKLTHSTWAGEERWLKFLILNDGTLIPVPDSHGDAIRSLSAGSSDYSIGDFDNSDGVQGKIDLNIKEIDLYYSEKLTSDQINTIMDLWSEYGCRWLVVDSDMNSFSTPVKSVEQLKGVLVYGKEMAVAVSDRLHFDLFDHLMKIREGLSVVQRELKLDLEQGELENSRGGWTDEEGWKKFLILTDGTVLKVPGDHGKSLVTSDGTQISKQFNEEGGIQGKIDTGNKEMLLFYPRVEIPNDDQIEAVRHLAGKYTIDTLLIDNKTGNFSVSVRSVDQIISILQYGPEMVVATTDERRKNGIIDESLYEMAKSLDDEFDEWEEGEGIFPSWFEDEGFISHDDFDLIHEYMDWDERPVGAVGDALERAVQKSKPSTKNVTLYRWMVVSNDFVSDIRTKLESGAYIKMNNPSSWASSLEGVEKFSHKKPRHTTNKVGIILEVKVRKGTKGVVLNSWENVGHEVVLSKNVKVRVKKIVDHGKGYIISGILQ